MAIVTIGGNIGAGKTALASGLAKTLHCKEWYAGHAFREMARARGIPIEQFYAELASDPALEKQVDEKTVALMREHKDLVVQGRIAWYLAKESEEAVFNIYLKVDPKIGAERTGRRPENKGRSTEELITINVKRDKTERERYRKLYGIQDFSDPNHYDFILDTSRLSIEETLEKVVEKLKERIGEDV